MSEQTADDGAPEVKVPQAVDPYAVLSVPKEATIGEIKKAYHKLALRHHPDKVATDRKDEAHTLFQRIAFAYAILSDPARRKLFDSTGSTSETLASTGPDWSWSDFYRAQYADVITAKAVAAFAEKYRGSDEERKDLINAFIAAEGNMDRVYEEVMLSDVMADDERFRGIIDDAINKGEVEGFKAYTKETKAKKENRVKKAKKEAKEAEELAKKLGVHAKLFGDEKNDGENLKDCSDDLKEDDGDDHEKKQDAHKKNAKLTSKKDKNDPEAGLAALIQARQAKRAKNDAFLDRLEEKYAPKHSKGKKKSEPDEAAFAATGKRMAETRKRKAVAEDEKAAEQAENPNKKKRTISKPAREPKVNSTRITRSSTRKAKEVGDGA